MDYDEAIKLEKTIKREIEILENLLKDPNTSLEKRALLEQKIEKLKLELSETQKAKFGTQKERRKI